VSSIVLVSEIYASRSVLTKELRILANTLSANSRQSLLLGQYAEIDVLLASLIQQENINAAYFFDSNGNPVAEYLQQHDSHFILQSLQNDFKETRKLFWTDSSTEHQISDIHHFSLFTPVFFEGKPIGTLYLLSDLKRLYGHLSGVAFGITFSLLLMIFFSWLLAGYFQKPVSVPLLKLAHLMDNVSQSGDYSVRAEKLSSDEIGLLVDGFNRMLAQIESHQANRAKHQAHLEKAVADRTVELRAAVIDLELARQQADTANDAKSHFLSRMTHELRTPLIGILGMNELLVRTPLSEQQQELVETVQKSGEQLLSLISEVLDFARIEAGKLWLEPHEFELARMFREVVGLLSPSAREKGLSLLLDVPVNASWDVKADEIKMRQILMNLIGNSIKFTSSGSITVSLNCTRHNDSVGTFVFEVVDTGIGMTTEVKQQIFDIFYQADGTGSGVKNGAGLGLAIVKQLVNLMDGEINLTSVSEQGSRFQ
ncbi:MAG: HAMP domain-containing protein, partial [Desulfuromusa sp.]|nr:HAMP domain-containing protein [Desulfuromusa sp.]